MPRKPSELTQTRLMKEKALARMRLCQAAELEGRLLPREQVLALWATVFSSLRDRALGMADRIASRGAHRSQEELRVIVESEIRSLLEVIGRGELV